MIDQGERMRSLLVPGIASALLLAGCQARPTFNSEDPAVIAAIESGLQAVMESAAKADAEQVVAGFRDDATFVTNDVMLTGRDDIRAQFADTYSSLASQTHTVRE